MGHLINVLLMGFPGRADSSREKERLRQPESISSTEPSLPLGEVIIPLSNRGTAHLHAVQQKHNVSHQWEPQM